MHFVGERKQLRLNSQLYRFGVMWKYKLVGSCSLRRKIFFFPFYFFWCFCLHVDWNNWQRGKDGGRSFGSGEFSQSSDCFEKKMHHKQLCRRLLSYCNEAFVKPRLFGLPANNYHHLSNCSVNRCLVLPKCQSFFKSNWQYWFSVMFFG